MYVVFVSLFLVVSSSAVSCPVRLVFRMTYYLPSGTLTLLTHSLCHITKVKLEHPFEVV